ncbi:MAG: DUF481 domain-containing protein [Granulosicoccus sp.]
MLDFKRRSRWASTRYFVLSQCLGICLLWLFFVHPAAAEWTGGIEGGTVVRDTGNATRLRLVLRNSTRPLSQYLYAEWLNSGSERNSYSVGYNPRYWLNDTYYTFGESRFRVDEALNIDQEIELLAGMGGQFLTNAQQSLYVELGVGGRSIGFDGFEDALNEALGVVRLGYFRSFADTVKFDLSADGGLSSEDVTEANGEIGLSLRIPNGAIRVAYRSRYLQVGDQESLTDNDSFVSFGYSF